MMRRSGIPFLILVLVPLVTVQGDDLRQRQQRIEELSAKEKQDLQRREQRFRSLSEAEQQRLREFNLSIENAPDSELLQAVMVRYHDWLNGLRPGQRADLLDLPPDQRVARIREILDTEAAQRFNRFAAAQLEVEDRRTIHDWLWNLARNHEEEVLPRLPEDYRSRIESPAADAKRRTFQIWVGLRFIPPQNWDFPAEVIAELHEELSPKAAEALDRERDPRKRVQLVGNWARAAILSMRGWQPSVPQEQLLEFFNTHVSSEDRARLESLPAEQLRTELEQRYHYYHRSRQRRAGDDGGRRGRSGSAGGRFGEGDRRSQRPDSPLQPE
jgi:hypothetical protein